MPTTAKQEKIASPEGICLFKMLLSFVLYAPMILHSIYRGLKSSVKKSTYSNSSINKSLKPRRVLSLPLASLSTDDRRSVATTQQTNRPGGRKDYGQFRLQIERLKTRG